MTTNRFIVLKSRPSGKVRASDFEIVAGPVPSPAGGQLLVKNLYLSLDPGVRNLLGVEEGYLPPIAIGNKLSGTVLGRVIETRHSSFEKGDLVLGRGWIGEYSLIVPNDLCWKFDPRLYPTLSSAIGVLGITGRTAYFGLLEVGRPKTGETVLISGAAGAVGSVAGQIARINGCRAVGIAGGETKRRRLVEEFGFDAAVDYKGRSVPELSAVIAEACPNGVDVFFDNVGGIVLDAALSRMNWAGRVAVCGLISQYDAAPPPRMTNLFYIVAKALRVEGFLLAQFADRYAQAVTDMRRWIAEGLLRYREEVAEGLDEAIPAFLSLFEGTNQGKTMVRLR
jgi:NADPH-dependent curcumin reductase CurA